MACAIAAKGPTATGFKPLSGFLAIVLTSSRPSSRTKTSALSTVGRMGGALAPLLLKLSAAEWSVGNGDGGFRRTQPPFFRPNSVTFRNLGGLLPEVGGLSREVGRLSRETLPRAVLPCAAMPW
jgi:hypothetical protein